MATPHWLELLEYARWTASPHNVQPWKFKILSETTAELYFEPSRLLWVEDPTGCFTTIGFGMFIEHLSIAAAEQGYFVEEEYEGAVLDHTKTKPTLFAKLTLKKTQKKEILTKELIKTRKTSRLPYNDKPVPQDILKDLQKVTEQFGHTFTITQDPEFIKWVLVLNRDTIFYDLDEEETRNEIGMWLRYSAEEANRKKDGLWSYCMSFPSVLMYLFFNARWIFNLPIINTLARKYYLDSTAGTKTVGWLSGPFATQQDWLHTGHMMARLWLTMTKYGVYLHPFGSIITNKQAHKRLSEKFNMEETKNPMWLIVRLGFSAEPPRSLRLTVADILLP